MFSYCSLPTLQWEYLLTFMYGVSFNFISIFSLEEYRSAAITLTVMLHIYNCELCWTPSLLRLCDLNQFFISILFSFSCFLFLSKKQLKQNWPAKIAFPLDTPSRPEGPLEVLDVTPDSCILKWSPPVVSSLAHILYFMSVCELYTLGD